MPSESTPLLYPANVVQQRQPQAHQQMSVPLERARNALDLPIAPDGKREWSNSLLDCFSDCGTCELSLRGAP